VAVEHRVRQGGRGDQDGDHGELRSRLCYQFASVSDVTYIHNKIRVEYGFR
jgi:hypothetical protein